MVADGMKFGMVGVGGERLAAVKAGEARSGCCVCSQGHKGEGVTGWNADEERSHSGRKVTQRREDG